MKISIAERFRPITHQPGEVCLLPLSKLSVQIFPALVRVCDLTDADPRLIAEFPIAVRGPVSQFTVLQDLEKGCLRVWGESKLGFFRYRIHATSGEMGFTCVVEKSPMGILESMIPSIFCGDHSILVMPDIERLSCGVTKVPDWTLVNRRLLLPEILPFWFRVGQLVPVVPAHLVGTASLFRFLDAALEAKDPVVLAEYFKELYQVAFHGILTPTLCDVLHQGANLSASAFESSGSPLWVLGKGAQMIRRMLLDHTPDGDVEVMRCVLPQLHAGRLCGAVCGEIGRIDLEWSKKKTRRMAFHSFKDQTLCFHFPKNLKSFRLSQPLLKVVSSKTCGVPLVFRADSTYFFDRFEQ